MSNLMQTLAFILPIIATLCVFTVISLNIYLKIRRKFPVKVNCWFCNESTKVHYDSYNSFYCPKCSQYNGFNEEGGYNKVLPEQRDELLNQQVPLIQKSNGFKLSNGLCHICNNNQKLKIYQLANFVPLNDDTFDVEVEHFQKQLEKAYKLCTRCDTVVKKVISKQNRWILGLKINTLKTKGLSLLDLNKSSNSLSKKSKQSLFLYFLNLMLILFASLIFLFTICNINFMSQDFKHTVNYIMSYNYLLFNIFKNSQFEFTNEFSKYLNINIISFSDQINSPTGFFGYFFDDNISTFSNLTRSIDTTFLKSLHLPRPNIHMLCVTGLFFQTTSLVFSERITYQNVKLFFSWCCLLAMTKSEYIALDPTVTLSLQIIISSYIVYVFFKDGRKNKPKRNKKMYTKTRTSKILSENKSLCESYLSQNDDDSVNDHSIMAHSSSTLKNKTTCNETDTANSDCSFGSFISGYTSIHNPFKEPLPRARSPLAPFQRDHTFGEPPNFVYTLVSSPELFRKISNSNSSFNGSYIFSKNLSRNCTSFDELGSQSKCESFKTFTRSKQLNVPTNTSNSNFDLNESLHNLHLDKNSYNIRAPKKVPITVLNNTPRPILSPPKLRCPSRSFWLPDDGFWNNVKDIHYEPANFSSSSSQSSGFASQSNDIPDLKLFKTLPHIELSTRTQQRFHKQNYTVYRSQNMLGQKEMPMSCHIFKPIQSNKIYRNNFMS